MRKYILLFLFLAARSFFAQAIYFNPKLDKFCKTAVKDFAVIPDERKLLLDSIAKQLFKKKYIVFTCQTNSRRTHLLQIWAQTAFYFYGLYDKHALSVGDTITPIYPEVAELLKESGFNCYGLTNDPQGYMVSISKEYQDIIIKPKIDIGNIDTLKGVVVNICYMGERSNLSENIKYLRLPYQSPKFFENTSLEKQRYEGLNKQISLEMLYIAAKTKEYVGIVPGSPY